MLKALCIENEGVDNSYLSRMMNLTVLSPDIVEATLDDALPDHLTLFDIAVDPAMLWEWQWSKLADAFLGQQKIHLHHQPSPEKPKLN